MVKLQSYKKLIVYQKSKKLVINIYEITEKFPKHERQAIIPQIRRAVLSIPANLVEGYAKESPKEFNKYLTIAIGSLFELEVFIDISFELKYLSYSVYNKITIQIDEVKRMLYGTRKSVRKKI